MHKGNPRLTMGCLATITSYNLLEKGGLWSVSKILTVNPLSWSHACTLGTKQHGHIYDVGASSDHMIMLYRDFSDTFGFW